MIGDLSFYGIYLPALALPLAMAYLASTALRALLSRTPFYLWVWHRALFNVSVFMIALQVAVRWTAGWFQ